MIIELFGPPGAGKSTLMASLEPHLRARGVSVTAHRAIGPLDPGGKPTSVLRRRRHQLAAIVLQPSLVMWCFRNRRVAGDLRVLALMCVRAWFARRLRRQPGIHLLDEGPLRIGPLLVALGATRGGPLLAHLPLPDAAVAVGADAELIIERVRSRHVGAISSATMSDDLLEFAHQHHLASVGLVTERIPVLEVDTSDGQDPTAAVADWVIDRLDEGGERRTEVGTDERSR